jgi:hypothetical protein
MARTMTGILAILLFTVGVGMASEDKQETKKDKKEPKIVTVVGNFESYKNEKLTLTVKGEAKSFKVPGDTFVGYTAGKDKKKVLKAKEHLKDVKKGTFVAVTLDGDKVLGVGVVVSELPEGKSREIKKDD